MNQLSKHSLSVLFWLNKQRVNNKGEFPIYVRITVDGKRAEVSLQRSIDPKFWDQKGQKALRAYGPNRDVLNSFLDLTKGKIQLIYNQLQIEDVKIAANLIRERFTGKSQSKREKSLCDAFDYHNRKMEESVLAGNITAKTLFRYDLAKRKVIDFMKREYQKEDIELCEIKYAFVTEFEHYLLTVDGLQRNTAHKMIKILKTIVDTAVNLEWVQSNPFRSFKCSYKNPERIVLTSLELDKLMNKEISIQRIAEVRDVFLFCCYTGFSYSDVYNFKQDVMHIGIDGKYWISTHRQKTGNKENVPLLPQALEIVKRYQQNPYCLKNDKLLPVNSNQRYNTYLKELADICGIKKHLTTHVARHTFATTVTLSNGVPIETVSKMLGHSKLATTQIYARVLENKVSDDMNALSRKLNQSTDEPDSEAI